VSTTTRTYSAAVPLVVVLDGRELALGPLEAALVRAVLAAAVTMRRQRAYRIELHVKHAAVVVEVTQHLADLVYAPDAAVR
jgi:hypothetical protein